jgi:hypothetical protein
MDDRDLEGRIRTHLHATLDDAKPSPDLASRVRAGLSPERVTPIGIRLRNLPSLRVGAALLAAALVVALLGLSGVLRAPQAGVATSVAPSTSPAARDFMVLPPTASLPSKSDTTIAINTMQSRLRALGFGTFSASAGNAIQFELGAGGASDDDVRGVLAAPGLVQLVPIPVDYPGTIVFGKPLPVSEPALLGNQDIANVTEATDQNGHPALNITVTGGNTQFLADYTGAHIGEQLAFVLDGNVVSAPLVQSPITDGTIEITDTSAATGFGLPATTHAILIGGVLPASWRGAWVPKVIASTEAVATALAAGTGTTLDGVSLDARLVVGQWRPIWAVAVTGTFPQMCTIQATQCPSVTSQTVLVDGVNGGVMGFEQTP